MDQFYSIYEETDNIGISFLEKSHESLANVLRQIDAS